MGKTLVYGGMEDFVLHHPIYVVSPNGDTQKYTTTAKNAANDICKLCETEEIDIIHLYGSLTFTTNLHSNILSNCLNFKNKQLTFMFN